MEKDTGVTANDKDGYNWVEIVAAVLLALATVATAWCAYQSARWSGVMTINFSAANAKRTEAVAIANYAFTEATYDAEVLLEYARAYVDDNTAELEVLENRFTRDELKKAIEAWIALDPENNPDAPKNPILMSEYKLASLEKAEDMNKEASELTDEAKEDNQRSDNYILLTVVFASVLFFAGISTKFSSHGVKIAMVLTGSAVFIAAVVILTFQPVH